MEDLELKKIRPGNFKKHPKEKANIIKQLLFCWQIPIILKAWKQELTEEDLYRPPEEYKSKRLGDKLERIWLDEENFSKNPSLTTALWKLVGAEFMFYGILFFIFELILLIGQPMCLKKILDYHTPNQTQVSVREAYTYATISATIILLCTITFHFIVLQLMSLGMKTRIACSSLIYRKTLKLKQSSLGKVTIGHMVNLLSNDVNKFETCFIFLHYIWMSPINFVLASCFLAFTLGLTAICGIGVIFIFIILQMYIVKKFLTARQNVAETTDYRVSLMNDVIYGIQVVKMYTWEKPYTRLIQNARIQEMIQVAKFNNIRFATIVFRTYISKLCVFISVLVATLMGFHLTSQYVFVMFGIYESLKISVTMLLQSAVGNLSETTTSIQRIQNYLLYSCQSSCLFYNKKTQTSSIDCGLKFKQQDCDKNCRICFKNVRVNWDSTSSVFTLENVNFEASLGQIVAVVGATGSGKSTLLYSILKEVDVIKGHVDVEGAISYAPQEPWIFSASIKQNILFGDDFDTQKYSKVLRICALEHDLALFSHGDQTRVGERGVMLSGGQKARISLARAIYRDADIYLLDDPLSAVDGQIAHQIFNDCICGYLKSKCVILVTHQIQYLKNVDTVYLIESQSVTKCNEESKIAHFGKYFVDDVVTMPEETKPKFLKQHQIQSDVKEHRSSDTTSKIAFKNYIQAGYFLYTCLVVCLFLFSVVSSVLVDYFMTFWINSEQGATRENSNLFNLLDKNYYLYTYTILLLLLIVSCHSTFCLFVTWCKTASKNLHNKMLQRILCATVTFFNQHSSGRILNRFAKDLGIIDEIIPGNFMLTMTNINLTLNALGLIIFSNYWMIIPTICVVVVIVGFRTIFQPTSRSLKRTEGITHSSSFTHLSASVQGLSIIKTFGMENKMMDEFDCHVDLHSSAFYLFTATFFAFGFWTDIICATFNISVMFSFFFLKTDSSMGFVGLAITQSTSLMRTINYSLKSWGDLEAKMVSVERVMEYTEIEVEANDSTVKVPEEWPTTGKLSFVSVSFRYSPDTPFVLKDISFEVKNGEKIGIIGRTGAGKTSLTSVLFRLFHYEGDVFIDGVNTKTISLNYLRSKISIIPQDPVLFLGTVRKNIDPFENYTDNEIWRYLEEVELKEMISKLPEGLESQISERGSNFSFGQKQLLCLVRALLTNNKLIVMDEATANVDLKTDELIQSVIRRKFRDSTVLTIAHRLNTVIDSDRILVLDDGRVKDFGHPFMLLQKEKGLFYNYVKKYGDRIMSEFMASAHKNYLQQDNTEGTQKTSC